MPRNFPLSFRHGGACPRQMPGGPGDLQVEAAGIGVNIQYFPGKIKPRGQL